MNQNHRVEDKQNVHRDGRRTMFKLYRRDGDSFVYAGLFTTQGWDASDEACVSSALENIDAEEARQNGF